MKNFNVAGQNRPIRVWLTISVLMVSLGVSRWCEGAGSDVSQLREQLAAAEELDDKAAIIELNRRIVALVPNDSDAWEKVVEGQLAAEDYDRAGQSLDAWTKAVKNPPASVEDFRGELALKRKDPAEAEKHFRAYLARKPSKEDSAAMYDKLADLLVDQQRITDAEACEAKAIAAQDTPARRVIHATALLRLHKWDAAYAEMDKANKADSTDAQVKEWLPQFERLAGFLPSIKQLEAQLAKKPNDVNLLLDRARLFTLANRPILALDDCQRALKLDPSSVRARIQTGEALLDQNRDEEAAKLQVGRSLARDSEKHVGEKSLKELGEEDAKIAKDPNAAEPLAQRSATLREINQYVLALADAEAALAIDEDSAAANYEAASSLRGLERPKEALVNAIRSTELDPASAGAWFLRGSLEADRADFPAAIESLTHSLQIREFLEGLRAREKCERRIGQVDKADLDLKRIRQLDPNTNE